MKTLVLIIPIFFTLPLLGQSKLEQGKSLFEKKNYTEANKILIVINDKDKDFAEASYYLGRIAYEQKKYELSAGYFEKAVNKNKQVADYYNWLGTAYATEAMNAGKLKQASLAPKMRDAWENAAKLDPKNLNARWSLVMFYCKAPSFMGGSMEDAKKMAEQIKKIDQAEGHRAFGFVFQEDKKPEQAEKEYIQASKLKPEYTMNLANFYMDQKLYSKVFPIVEKGMVDEPENYIWIYMHGKLSALTGLKPDKGKECLEKYLKRTPSKNEPSHAGAHMRLAQIYEKKGNKAEAKRLFQLALKSDPKLKEAKEGLERVSK